MALFDEVVVEAGKTATLEFHWAILVNGLAKPWGRIRLEKARDKGTLMDLGLEAKELGIEVPKDGSALEMHLVDPRGSVEKSFVRIAPGERKVVKWKKSSP
jgi:hypothetical protein